MSLIAGQLQDRVVPIRQRIAADCWATTLFGSSHCVTLFWQLCAFVCHRFVTEAGCVESRTFRTVVGAVVASLHDVLAPVRTRALHVQPTRVLCVGGGAGQCGEDGKLPASPTRTLTPTTQSHVCTHTSACTHSRVVASVALVCTKPPPPPIGHYWQNRLGRPKSIACYR